MSTPTRQRHGTPGRFTRAGRSVLAVSLLAVPFQLVGPAYVAASTGSGAGVISTVAGNSDAESGFAGSTLPRV